MIDNPIYSELDRLYQQNLELRQRLGSVLAENRRLRRTLGLIVKVLKYNLPRRKNEQTR